MPERDEDQKKRRARRKRLVRGLLIGGAAVGIPAVANLLIARRAGKIPAPAWGRAHRYVWRFGEVVFQRLGEGPPLLLLHSFGAGHDGAEWRRAAERLAESHSVFVPDLLGWGRSEKPSIAYDGELFIQLVADFLADVVRQRAAVAAAGLPAAYAVQVAVDQPELVTALALVVPQGLELNSEEPDLQDAVVHRLLRLPIFGTSALNLYTSRKGIVRHLQNEVHAARERLDPALLEHHYRSSHQHGAHAALAAYLAGYLNHDIGPELPRLTLPLWLAWGRHASNPPVETSDLWLHHTLGAQLEVFEHSAGLPHTEEPAAFCKRLAGFLASGSAP